MADSEPPLPVVRLGLAHETSRASTTKSGFTKTTTTTTIRYQVHPLGGARRPTAGTESYAVYCGTCRKSVQVMVDADPVVMAKRRQQRGWGWVVVLAGVAVMALGIPKPAFFLGGVLVLVLGAVVVTGARSQQGVRVSKDQPIAARRGHTIRERRGV
ncbi:hypothetical protein KGQ19_26765 [Catenulispora sp. NL8]|uniref:Integral membrane protein n=1 Tax=Catenulispora pinistramenti TaxID=2705254 RepID=A0ABS5KWQ0_9ACTN|nr:hypothetical protein [Catenulispora pinistramenti]MBS2550478.1 hypothetical protein [Catenulispora pinistramenti]